jgi:hypothetical protein
MLLGAGRTDTENPFEGLMTEARDFQNRLELGFASKTVQERTGCEVRIAKETRFDTAPKNAESRGFIYSRSPAGWPAAARRCSAAKTVSSSLPPGVQLCFIDGAHRPAPTAPLMPSTWLGSRMVTFGY